MGSCSFLCTYTLLHNILDFTGVYEWFPSVKFLPLYLHCQFSHAAFYYVKLSLYPAYELRWTDVKHFMLPVFQFLFFLFFFMPGRIQNPLVGHFTTPLRAFEQFLYLMTLLPICIFRIVTFPEKG